MDQQQHSARRRNIVDYVAETVQTFDQLPFNRVDAMVLSMLASLHWEVATSVEPGSNPANAPRINDLAMYDPLIVQTRDEYVESHTMLMARLHESPRWSQLRLAGYQSIYDEERCEQFSSSAFLLPDGTTFVAFRGTDLSLVGWREDFMLAFEPVVPSHLSAREFLDKVGHATQGDLLVGGHSKGGNLAAYAAATCDAAVRQRIRKIYNFDGPGFTGATIAQANIHGIEHLVDKTVPRSSVIGRMLTTTQHVRVADSTARGMAQHNPYTWVVEGTDFTDIPSTSPYSDYAHRTLAPWVESLSQHEMRAVTQALSEIFKAGNPYAVELSPGKLPAHLEALHEMDHDTRNTFLRAAGKLARRAIAALASPRKPKTGGGSL